MSSVRTSRCSRPVTLISLGVRRYLAHDLLRRGDDLLGRGGDVGLLRLVARDRSVHSGDSCRRRLERVEALLAHGGGDLGGTPQRRRPSSAMTRCPVFDAESRMARSSSGTRVRRSITSAWIPSAANWFAASSEVATIIEQATIETSAPSRFTAAWPTGIS